MKFKPSLLFRGGGFFVSQVQGRRQGVPPFLYPCQDKLRLGVPCFLQKKVQKKILTLIKLCVLL